MCEYAIFLAVKGIINVTDAAREDGSFDAGDVFTNSSGVRLFHVTLLTPS